MAFRMTDLGSLPGGSAQPDLYTTGPGPETTGLPDD